MRTDYLMIVDNTPARNMIGTAERDNGGVYVRGHLNGAFFSCPSDQVAAFVAMRTGHRASVVWLSEPVWKLGTVIA